MPGVKTSLDRIFIKFSDAILYKIGFKLLLLLARSYIGKPFVVASHRL